VKSSNENLYQAAWFVDQANASGTASDANVGDSAAHALLTDDEMKRRLGGDNRRWRTLVDTTITYMSGTSTYVPFDVKLGLGDLTIIGTSTASSGSLTSNLTAANRAAQTLNKVTDTGRNWSTQTNKVVRIASGARAGAQWWTSVDTGSGIAEVSTPGTPSTAWPNFARATPQSGDPYSILTPPALTCGQWRFDLDNSAGKKVTIKDLALNFNGMTNGIYGDAAAINIQACSITDAVVKADFIFFEQCLTLGYLWLDPGAYATILACLHRSHVQLNAGSFALIDFDDLYDAGGALTLLGACTANVGTACVRGRGVSDDAVVVADGAFIRNTQQIDSATQLWGSSNAGHGVVVKGGSGLHYTNQPTVNAGVGPGRELNLGGTDYQYSAVPSGQVNAANGARFVPY